MPDVMDWSAQSPTGADAYADFLVPAMFEPFAPGIVEAAGIASEAVVVDVACGTGVVTRAAARRAGVLGQVTGVDLGGPMLEVAQATSGSALAAPVTYVQGSAESLPVPDASADAVLCHHGLQFFGDRDRALREMRRVLRPEGTAVVACWAAIDQQRHMAALADALERHLGATAGTMMRSPFAIGAPDELAELLTAAGFADVQVQAETLPVLFASFPDFARRAIAAGPVGGPFAAAPAATQEAVVDDVRTALDDLETNSGELASEMTSLVATGRA